MPGAASVEPADEAPGAPAGGDGVWAPHRRRLTTGLVMTITLAAVESLAIATVMPRVEEDLGGLALYGWVFSAFFLASMAGIVVAGQLADRRGPALPFAAGLALFAAGLAAGGLAPSMPVLVAARAAQGFGAGAIPAAAYAAVARGYRPSARPRIFALFSTAWVVPGLIGPSLASLVERATSWRYVFLGILPLVLVAGGIALPALRALPRAAGTGADALAGVPVDRPRIGRVVALIVGVGAVLAAGTSHQPLLGVGLVVTGAPLAAWAFLRLVPTGTVGLRPGLPAVVAVRGVLTWAFFGCDAFVSLAVTEARGGSTLLAGAALTATTLAWTAAAWLQEPLLDRVGPRRLDRIGFALIAAAAVGMVVMALRLPAWAALPIWSVGGFGMGLAYSPLSVLALGLAPAGEEGAASSALQLCETVGVSIGTGLSGVLVALADRHGWSVTVGVAMAFAIGVLIALTGLLAARRLPTRLPSAAT